MTQSGHFFADDWSDFVRETASPQRQSAMQRHLDRGCGKCMELHTAWRRVLTTAESERQYEPPKAALRRANALFNVRRQESRLARVLVAAQLLFDSGLAAVPVGVRSMGPDRRKLLYASDGFLIDLLVECARDRGHAALIG